MRVAVISTEPLATPSILEMGGAASHDTRDQTIALLSHLQASGPEIVNVLTLMGVHVKVRRVQQIAAAQGVPLLHALGPLR